MKIELDQETIDVIVREELESLIVYFQDCIHDEDLAIFSYDPKEEVEELNKLIDAADIILSYYKEAY